MSWTSSQYSTYTLDGSGKDEVKGGERETKWGGQDSKERGGGEIQACENEREREREREREGGGQRNLLTDQKTDRRVEWESTEEIL